MLCIHAVGEFRVEVAGTDRTSAAFDRATALLAWLALNPGVHGRSAVAARFWPDVLDESARASLRSALWSLRRQLGETANGALIATRDRVGLADDVWTDVRESERLREEGPLEEALALADGELLPGFEDEWAYAVREEHRAQVAQLLEELACRLAVIAAYREDEADARLYGALADLRRTCDVDRIELGGLGLEEVAALIGSAFETSAAGPRLMRSTTEVGAIRSTSASSPVMWRGARRRGRRRPLPVRPRTDARRGLRGARRQPEGAPPSLSGGRAHGTVRTRSARSPHRDRAPPLRGSRRRTRR
jgi:hypothetical protein